MKNKGLKIVLVIILMIFCGFGGWFLGAKVFDKEDKVVNKDKEEITDKKEIEIEEQTQVAKQAVQAINTDVGTFIVDKDGSVYYRKGNKYANGNININFKDDSVLGAKGTYEVEDYITDLDYDEVNKQHIEKHNFDGYKLDLENILSIYEIHVGNGVSNTIYFLSKDGKVNSLHFAVVSEDTPIEVTLKKDICKYPNIVSIVQSSGFDALEVIFVDKDGNKYTGTELAKESQN